MSTEKTVNLLKDPIPTLVGVSILLFHTKSNKDFEFKITDVTQDSDDHRVVHVVDVTTGEAKAIGVTADKKSMLAARVASTPEPEETDDFGDAPADDADDFSGDNAPEDAFDDSAMDADVADAAAPPAKSTGDIIDELLAASKAAGGVMSRRELSKQMGEAGLTGDNLKAFGKDNLKMAILKAGAVLTQHNIVWDGSQEGETLESVQAGTPAPVAAPAAAPAPKSKPVETTPAEHVEVEKNLTEAIANDNDKDTRTAKATRGASVSFSPSVAAIVLPNSTFADLANGLAVLLNAGILTEKEARAFIL